MVQGLGQVAHDLGGWGGRVGSGGSWSGGMGQVAHGLEGKGQVTWKGLDQVAYGLREEGWVRWLMVW